MWYVRSRKASLLVSNLPGDLLPWPSGRSAGRAYIGTVPSKKRVIRICEAISEMTGRDQTLLDQGMVVGKLNRTMIGWPTTFA